MATASVARRNKVRRRDAEAHSEVGEFSLVEFTVPWPQIHVSEGAAQGWVTSFLACRLSHGLPWHV